MSTVRSGITSQTDSHTSARFQSIEPGVFQTVSILSTSVRTQRSQGRRSEGAIVVTLGTGGTQHIPRPPSYRLGEPAPWQDVPPELRRLSLADVRARLADLPP